MTAAIAPPLPALHAETETSASAARKRRREIMLHQRAAGMASVSPSKSILVTQTPVPPSAASVCPSVSLVQVVEQDSPLPVKKRRVVEKGALNLVNVPAPAPVGVVCPQVDEAPTKIAALKETESKKCDIAKAKKPQMRYDPSVPMSKEETAAWRREQRRKRNRESAAASRQRQRDRIAELEVELDGWKDKFSEVMARLNVLEKSRGMAPTQDIITGDQATSNNSQVSPDNSPQPSFGSFVPPIDPQARDQASPSSVSKGGAMERVESQQEQQQQAQHTEHLNETISRPA
mmetsp:Transcript_12124/g.35437  ORF Transcript_12124/g.35437 Transcript_12124/m.35437 type:complete len:290 (-) Transcript_12124:1104-1973(-)